MAKQKLSFTKSNLDMLSDRLKSSTTRLGVRNDLSLGGVDIYCDDVWEFSMGIVGLRVVAATELTQEDAVKEGFISVQELKDELEKCYGQPINAEQLLTVVDLAG